ncbi:phytase [Paenibacillus xanthanilyticus]|uniref:Phytase n=1 Tax=Paenibacillus xanthanilyticus TaxID=1783531 RepID=A0ABV8K3S7_9BACL
MNKFASAILAASLLLPTGSAIAATPAAAEELVPLREKLAAIGAAVQWEEEDKAILFKLKNGIAGIVTLGEKEYRLAGKDGKLAQPIQAARGIIHVPESLWARIEAANAKYDGQPIPAFSVKAQGETSAVADGDDAADDPAIWVDPADPAKSKLIATNKAGGVLVYDLSGKQLQSYKLGKMNNIDLRYNFPLGGKKVDIVAATNRTSNTIDVFTIDGKSGALKSVTAAPIKSAMGEVYGFSLYHSIKTGKFYAIALGKDGEFEQYLLSDNGKGKIVGKLVRSFQLATQSEGIVADDEYGTLYIAEEDYAIWKYDAEPSGSKKPLATVDIADGRRVQDDIEGLTLYYGQGGTGYLIASSQGSNSYAIYDRQGNNPFLSRFTIADGETADGTTETDGIDVVGFGLGSAYPYGLFVSQDDRNMQGGKKLNQNFKLVGWEQIAAGLHASPSAEGGVDPRKLVWRKN